MSSVTEKPSRVKMKLSVQTSLTPMMGMVIRQWKRCRSLIICISQAIMNAFWCEMQAVAPFQLSLQIADMVRELRQKGLGEAEVARAHAQWLEDEDDKALKELMSGIKRGLKKGRNRVEVYDRIAYI